MPEKTDFYNKQSSMLKRLAAIFYDSLLLFSLFFLATMVLIFFTNFESIESNNIAYDLYLLLIAYLYFVWHWVNGGQTLGMRAWHIKLIKQGNDPLRWRDATVRFCLALLSLISFGLGFVWVFFDKEKLTFHDRYSNTQLIGYKQ
ncbi:MAG: RDD family protein [Gammaproteobacteria bacterium]